MVNALREKTGGNDCVNSLKEGIREVDMMLKANPEAIEKEFKLVLKPLNLIVSVLGLRLHKKLENI